MKKLLLFAAAVLVALSSCEDPDHRRGDELYMFTQPFDVKEADWIAYPNDVNVDYYYFTFNMPQLTRKVCEIGEVSVTCYADGDWQSQLPETLYFYDGDYTWSETIRYEYLPGKIKFIVSSSDFGSVRPRHLWFRVVLNY